MKTALQARGKRFNVLYCHFTFRNGLSIVVQYRYRGTSHALIEACLD